MTDCIYYQNYEGPSLIKATLNKKDITEKIQKYYGEKNNWNGKLWKYSDIFDSNDYLSPFYCEFKGKDERVHWFHGVVGKQEQYFNPSLHTPMNQIKT